MSTTSIKILGAQMDSHLRSIAKAVTWRAGGSLATAVIAFALTGETKTAVVIGAADTVIKIGAFYVHERLWEKVHFGKPKKPDYQI